MRSRSSHPKKTFGGSPDKEKTNSIYGLTVKGINDKRKFDIKLGKTVRMEPNDLSNPIIASWITAFVRSVLGECMHNIQKLNGLVVSATTDGFITNIQDLENKLNKLSDEEASEFDSETFKWLNNLIGGPRPPFGGAGAHLNLYNILLNRLKEEEKTLDLNKDEGLARELKESDFLNDYKSLMENIYQKIDSGTPPPLRGGGGPFFFKKKKKKAI